MLVCATSSLPLPCSSWQYALMSDLWRQGLAVRPFAGRWGDPSLPQHMDTKKNYTMIVSKQYGYSCYCTAQSWQ